jgi:hypothetical protein
MTIKALCLATLCIFFTSNVWADVCPADFKRPSYPTRSFFCSTGTYVVDAYSGQKILCEDMEVDHLIPLKIAHCAGLSEDELKKFAKDKRNLRFTYWKTNRQKAAKSLHSFSQTIENPKIRKKILIEGSELMTEYKIPLGADLSSLVLKTVRAQSNELAKLKSKTNVLIDGKPIPLRKAVKKTSTKIAVRTGKGLLRNIAFLPAEQIPLIGLAITVYLISKDIQSSCETVTELETLHQAMFPGDNPEFNSDEVCGQKVPNPDEVIEALKNGDLLEKLKTDYPELIDEISNQLPELKTPDWEFPKLDEWKLPEVPSFSWGKSEDITVYD